MSLKFLFIILLGFALTGCGSDSDNAGGGNNKPKKANYVNWEAIPSEFNPMIDNVSFRTDGIEKIHINAFGFDKDVEVVYSPEVAPNEGFIKIFKVWKKQASWGNLQASSSGKNLDLTNYGSYQCSIQVQNGQITSLEGGCYVRVQIFMPVGAEIEIYNLGQLITQRFIPMDNQTFFESLDKAPWADDKFVVIENFLASYTGSKKPALTCNELGQVIKKFPFSEEKFNALRKLHSVVSDRENLGKMIDIEFTFFDREEAKEIVGLD